MESARAASLPVITAIPSRGRPQAHPWGKRAEAREVKPAGILSLPGQGGLQAPRPALSDTHLKDCSTYIRVSPAD